MGKFNEYVFREYNDINRAVRFSKSVKKLNVLLPENLNNYSAEFSKFVNLQSLDIHAKLNHVPYLPEQIGSLSMLKRLSILNVPFIEYPLWIFGLKNLEYLMVRGHEIKYIPLGVAALSKLKVLRLENCDLVKLPEDLRDLKKLEELSVVDTNITISPEVLPIGLKRLRTTYHDKSVLKGELRSLPNLEVI